jgi:hypothetical protein
MKPVRFSICGKAYEYQMSHVTRYLMKQVEEHKKVIQQKLVEAEKKSDFVESESKKIEIKVE